MGFGELRDQKPEVTGKIVWVLFKIIGQILIFSLLMEGGVADIHLSSLITPYSSIDLRNLFLLFSATRAISQVYFGVLLLPYRMPVGVAIGVELMNVVIDSVHGILVIRLQNNGLTSFEYVVAIVFFSGILLERVAEAQRIAWKKLPKNKGKPHTKGLFGFLVHANYSGFALWHIATTLLTRSVVLQLFNVGIIYNFIGQAKEQHTRNSKKYGQSFESYWNSTQKLVPFLY